MSNPPEKGSTVEVSFGHGNKMVSGTGLIRDVSGDQIVLDIDGCDKEVTLEPGTDIYLMKGGGLHNVLESIDFPRITIEKVYERLHARVNDMLSVRYRTVNPDEYDLNDPRSKVILEDIFGEVQSVPEVENVTPAMLYRLLYQLHLKIDRLMDATQLKQASLFQVAPLEQINISAAGVRLMLSEKLDEGTIVALRLDLPLETSTRLQALGEVITVDPAGKNDKYRTSIKFIDLSEETEEVITRYVFKRQRELLRGECE